MAKERIVTRTIQTSKVTVLCMNLQTEEPVTKEVSLSGVYKDKAAVLKAAEQVINSETLKAVHVVDVKVEEALYGMSEQKFVELAEVLPPRKNYNKD